MTNEATVVVQPDPAARRLTEQVHFLTNREGRALLLGLTALAAAEGDYPAPSEGEIVRMLLVDAAEKLYARDRARYEAAIRAGRSALADLDVKRAARAAAPVTPRKPRRARSRA
jgi:hypothetical protein